MKIKFIINLKTMLLICWLCIHV